MAAADVQRSLRLSPAALGLLLSGSVGVGGVASALSGPVLARRGARSVLVASLVVWALASVMAAVVPTTGMFLAGFVVAMVAAGLVDMAMNALAAAGVGTDATGMLRFHALFNAGALTGAAITGVLVHAGASWHWTWTGTAAVGLLLALALTGASPTPASARATALASTPSSPTPSSPTPSSPTGAALAAARPYRAMRLLGLGTLAVAFVGTAAVEGGIDTWGVLYLRRHLAAGVLLGAGAYCIGQAIAVTVRGAGSRAIGRIGPRWGLVAGAGIAAAGIGLEAAAGVAVVAAVGLVLAAAGIAVCWPLGMSAVSGRAALAGTSPAPLVAALTASGYVGWVAGPALVGLVAQGGGLRTGLSLLAGVAAVAAACLATIPATAGPR